MQEGLNSIPFSLLLPYGVADDWQKRTDEYFKHLIKFHEGRFAVDLQFRYFLKDSILKLRDFSVGRYILCKIQIFTYECTADAWTSSVRRRTFYDSTISKSGHICDDKCAK